jgi:GntR family transcriptional regulator, transcriptional repressor for pyruvate dehydrogenase complex
MATTIFRPIRPHRTFEQAIAQIAEAITNGTLQPGEALPGERALAAAMDVSRRTIREAMKVLAEAGVIEVVPGPGGGTFVRSEIVPADLTFHVETHVSELSDVLEVRRLVEPRVAQLAGVYAEREDFEELERIVALQRESATDRERYLALESRFHLTMARIARNSVLYEMMKNLFGRVLVLADLAFDADAASARMPLDIHQQTLEALRTRDPVVIEDVMDVHLHYLEDMWVARGGRLRFRALPTILMRDGDRPSSRS